MLPAQLPILQSLQESSHEYGAVQVVPMLMHYLLLVSQQFDLAADIIADRSCICGCFGRILIVAQWHDELLKLHSYPFSLNWTRAQHITARAKHELDFK